MKHYGTQHKRLFGQWCVKINHHKISIVGNWHSNYGLIYPHMVKRWAKGVDCQVIGMDNSYGMTKQVKTYIYNYIHKHYKGLAHA